MADWVPVNRKQRGGKKGNSSNEQTASGKANAATKDGIPSQQQRKGTNLKAQAQAQAQAPAPAPAQGQSKQADATNGSAPPSRSNTTPVLTEEKHVPHNNFNTSEIEKLLRAAGDKKGTIYKPSMKVPKSGSPWGTKRGSRLRVLVD